jgi:RHS repeat-associated protein
MEYQRNDNPEMQPYKYNGKEFIEEHGLDEYDFSARNMYPAIMRFNTPDPLAEDYYDVSPYVYGLNNPVRYNDPTGMSANDSVGTPNVELPEVVVTANRNSLVGSRVMDPVSGFWGWLGYFAFGRTYESNVTQYGASFYTHWDVDSNGIITGVQPIMGTPPAPVFKGGNLFIKGFKYVDKLNFHRVVKPRILKEISKTKDFSKIVGTNPNVIVEKGKIVLQGAKDSPFKGQILNTELNAIDFLK